MADPRDGGDISTRIIYYAVYVSLSPELFIKILSISSIYLLNKDLHNIDVYGPTHLKNAISVLQL